jgi:hypothetical protein
MAARQELWRWELGDPCGSRWSMLQQWQGTLQQKTDALARSVRKMVVIPAKAGIHVANWKPDQDQGGFPISRE